MIDAQTPVRGAGAPQPGHDRGTLLAGALLAAVVALAWALLVARASETGAGLSLPPVAPPWPTGRAPTVLAENREPTQPLGERAVLALRGALRARGLPLVVVEGTMNALRHDAEQETDSGDGSSPRGAWSPHPGAAGGSGTPTPRRRPTMPSARPPRRAKPRVSTPRPPWLGPR